MSLSSLSLFSTGMQVLPIFEEMQRNGMPASRSEFQSLFSYLEKEMIRLQSEISTKYFFGRPFNPSGSGHDTAKLLNRHNLKALKRTKKGAISTAKKSIEYLREDHPAVDLIFQWREHQTIKSTFCDPLLRIAEEQLYGKPEEDIFHVHSNFKPVTTEPRRLSTEDPPMLNVPARTELGRRVRGCYRTISPEVFGAWDFSGQEMRVAAHVSQDTLLCRLFSTCKWCGKELFNAPPLEKCAKSPKSRHEEGDAHSAAAERIFGKKESDVDKDTWKNDYRRPTKTANFGILYGMQGEGLMDLFWQYGLRWPKRECENLIKEILKKVYKGLSTSIKDAESLARRQGHIRDLYGMIRYLPMIRSLDRSESAEAGRQAFSHLIQGTAQGMMQNAMSWLRPRIWELQDCGMDVKWRLQIHDEILFSFHRDLWEVVDELVVEGMTQHYGLKLRVPVTVEGHMANSWSELK